MGLQKRMLEEAESRGFSVDDEIIICTNCFGDYALKEIISNNDVSISCTYCEKTGTSACSLDFIMDHIMQGIRQEWGDPNNEGMSWESREGGWQGAVYDSWELIDEVGLDVENDDLREEIINSLWGDEWCHKGLYSLTADRTLFYGWKEFSEFVITESRYVFLRATPSTYDEFQHDQMHPVKILDTLMEIVQDFGLVRSVSMDTGIYRVRVVDLDITLSIAKDIGSPALEYAVIPNRMSPAGISMFYGAFDTATAIAETFDGTRSDDKKAVCGLFHPSRELLLLDLARPLSVPSLYDYGRVEQRYLISFLIDFIVDFTSPISRDDRSHIEYVPTQIVTEYFRYFFKTAEGKGIDGIIYPSSKLQGNPAIVLFADSSQCVDRGAEITGESLLSLYEIKDVDIPC